MTGQGRQLVLLGVLVLGLGGASTYMLTGGSQTESAERPSNRATGRRAPQARSDAPPVADVRLELLEPPSQELSGPTRDPFRFRPKPPPPAPAPVRQPPPRFEDLAPIEPAGPPPPPPILLRYIGFVEASGAAARVAILSDGRNNVFHAKEGDIIEGRYRVHRVGVDSVELAYLDGRGRQTIRLSGQ